MTPDTLKAYQEVEQTRQALLRGEATAKTLAYARFLNAIENDATISHSAFKKCETDDDEVAREWPFLRDMMKKGKSHDPR
jgi:hypothetical protein